MPDHDRFAVFILTHGRPDQVVTWETMKRYGYEGRIYLVIDNEDARGDEYRDRFGADNVIEFDKAAVGETFDIADTQQDRRATVFARNASFAIARNLGLDYFVQLDDDYPSFLYRYVDAEGRVHGRILGPSINGVFAAMLDFLDATGAASVAFSQGGDHMGGSRDNVDEGLRRKTMNSWFCRTDRPIEFVGRMNDDVNTYVVNGARGDLFLTVMGLQLNQPPTQSLAGGMTELYRDNGTYMKSFYTVMMAPSCATVRTMGRTSRRMHHSISWDHAVPKILSDRHRKPRPDLVRA